MKYLKNTGFLIFFLILFGCQPTFEEPEISLSDYKIEEGFELKMIASEPLLVAPVAMDFDLQGRMWVAEMTSYMSDIDGVGEDEPNGTIKILEDRDGDGVMDHSKIFLEGLVLPRALALVYGGLLYAEPPNLWFVEIDGDQPGKRTLVDAAYAVEGNPEHQPNGLLLNIDNWIYSAKAHTRYQRKDGKWYKEATSFRGQWGISKDNFGRLYYNDNSRQLLGDYVLPNRLINNQHHIPKAAVNQMLTKDQRVYPLQAIDVNRGYAEGVLDKDSLLVNVTAACGPLVYRGGRFPKGYDQNAFVCVPEANLIKRNILTFHQDHTTAKQAYEGKEFLASLDEGFRPVNLYNGPDGKMYVIDMHRGVIGHHAYLSPYLKKKILEKQMDTLISKGRILSIQNKEERAAKIPLLEQLDASELVALLKDSNGWIRDHAQHLMIYKKHTKAVPWLIKMAKNTEFPLAQMHALHTLKGLDALTYPVLKNVMLSSNSEVVSHGIVLMEDFAIEEYGAATQKLFEDLAIKNELDIDLYLLATLGRWTKISKERFSPLLFKLAEKHKSKPIFTDAILSGVGEIAIAFSEDLETHNVLKESDLASALVVSLERRAEEKTNPIFSEEMLSEDNRTRGVKLFRQICSSCHGSSGEGIEGLAPPLMNSEYVASMPIEKLGLIILHGLKGPVHVNGKLYEMNSAMPGLLSNTALSDKDIADVMAYVTNAFSDTPRGIEEEKIKELRKRIPQSGSEYTEEELKKYSSK